MDNTYREYNIALICDDAYVMPTAVTIKSIQENYSVPYGEKVIISVCTYGISKENERLLTELSEKSLSVQIVKVNVDKLSIKFNKISQKSHVTPTSLIKFELPNIFGNIEKLLYLDSDIIVLGNIIELFQLDISDEYVAASFEFWNYLNLYWGGNKDSTSRPTFYFNSGVMLMNLSMMRKNDISKALWLKKYELQVDKSKTTMDQDTLNEVFAGHVNPLSIVWNYNTKFYSNPDILHINQVYNTSFVDREDIQNNIKVLNYVGKEDKPWKFLTANCRAIWDNYYEKCGFSMEALKREKSVHDLQWYWNIILTQIRKNGIQGLFRYLRYKLTNR